MALQFTHTPVLARVLYRVIVADTCRVHSEDCTRPFSLGLVVVHPKLYPWPASTSRLIPQYQAGADGYLVEESGDNRVRYLVEESGDNRVRYLVEESGDNRVRYLVEESGDNRVRYLVEESGDNRVRPYQFICTLFGQVVVVSQKVRISQGYISGENDGFA